MSGGFALNELDDLFQRALALTGAERAEFVERECGNRNALRAELLRVLDAHMNAGEFLDSSLFSYLSTGGKRTSIGRWQLLEQIGEGGLGIVYRAACEADGVTLHAAVKVLRAGLHKGIFHQRFIQERSILSGVDHPYIARLIDAGADDSGDSFLAVEFVPGRTLDLCLRESNPSLRERLDIFIRICEAVEYLHSHCIVHGDIKPANVMIKENGTPKLLDFGAARLIDSGRPESSARFSRLIMTPGYASPEQMAGLGSSVAGDVYSVGCVLRDMLEQVTPEADLIAIRDRCLADSPASRYHSPQEIAADVRRYLRHFPVHAYAASRWYATRKFIRRNRLAGSLAGLAAAALFAASLLSWYHAGRADLYQRQHRSVVNHLVGDNAASQAPESSQSAALTGSVRDVISHLETMTPQPLSELTGAWRRLSYTEARSGRTQQGIESIARSIEYARRNVAANGSAETRADLARSLLYAAILRNQRGEIGKAGDHGVEAIRMIEMLPAVERSAFEHRPEFLYALFPAARHMALSGDIESGRDLLLRGLERSRSMGKSIQLRMLLDVATFERRAGNSEKVESYCTEAIALELTNPRLENLCAHPSGDAGQHTAGLIQEASLLEKRLVLDPDNFADRQQLARVRLQLARLAAAAGETARAARLIDEAEALAKPLVEADPENLRLQQLVRNIKRQRNARSGLVAAR